MRQICSNICLLLFCSYFFPANIYSQDTPETSAEYFYRLVEENYGADPVLVNGKYFEDIYRNDLGHPYFSDDRFFPGYCIIHQKKFENLQLRYNIFDQSLVVSCSNGNNASVVFIPPDEFISEFSVDGQVFRKYIFPESKTAFYREMYVGKELKLLENWTKKRYDSYHNKTYLAYKFSAEHKNYYVVIDHAAFQFKSKRSFVMLFEKENRKAILNFIREQDINFRKADPQKFSELGTFCDTILCKGGSEN
jgi:hypothetical protein